MNKFNDWTNSDGPYVIISIVLALVFVFGFLGNYNNFLIKFIFFGVITTLLFFLFKYLRVLKKNVGSDTVMNVDDKEAVNIPKRTRAEVLNDSNSESEYGNTVMESYQNNIYEHIDPVIDGNIEGEEIPSTGEIKGSFVLNRHHTTQEEHHHQVPQEEHHYHVPQEEHHHPLPQEEHHHRVPQEEHHIQQPTVQEEQLFVDHKQVVDEEEERPDISRHTGVHKKNTSPKVPTYKPYQTPVNINVSYITKSNFASDDVISDNRVEPFNPPNYTERVFNNDVPDNNYAINYMNSKLNVENPNHNQYQPPNVLCNGPRCDPKPIRLPDRKRDRRVNKLRRKQNKRDKDQNNNSFSDQDPYNPDVYKPYMYSGNGFDYVKPGYQNYPAPQEPIGCKVNKCEVCPMELDTWSKWKPGYLTGNDITE